MDLSSYRQLYNQTAHDLLNSIQNNLSVYLSSSSMDAVKQLHMDSHSLKSQSNVMGYAKTAALCLALEHIFRSIKDQTLLPSDQLKDTIKQAVSHLGESLSSIEQAGTEKDLTQDTQLLTSQSGISV